VSGKRHRDTRRRGGTRRRGTGRGGGWTAAQAAYQVVKLRDELLARYPDNPLLLRNDIVTREDVIGQWIQVYRQSGISEKEALHLAAARSGHTAPLPAGTTIGSLAELMIRDAIARETAALQRAELYVVSPAMHAAAAAAAGTVTEDDLTSLTEDDVPASAGFVLLPGIQMLQQPGRPHPEEILALLWSTRTIALRTDPGVRALEIEAWVDGNGPVQVPDFIHARRLAAQAGHPFPRLMPIHHARLLLDRPPAGANHPLVDEMLDRAKAVQPTLNADGVEVGEHHGSVIDALADDWIRAYLFAFVRLCAQQIAVTTPYRELRGTVLPARPTDPVRVTQLRSFSELADVDQDRHRSYHHRWVVRMHKVRQWYPSQGLHKIIWRGPYIKGPANAPLLTGERINALVR
jgi:hypothetical protein